MQGYTIASAHRFDFHLTFSNPALQALEAAAAGAPDGAAFRCCVPAGEPWEPYSELILDGIWEQCESWVCCGRVRSPGRHGDGTAMAGGARGQAACPASPACARLSRPSLTLSSAAANAADVSKFSPVPKKRPGAVAVVADGSHCRAAVDAAA